MFIGSLAVYSWASERMPWLVLHPLLPLTLLAGVGAQVVWVARRRPLAKVALAAAAAATVGAVYFSVGLSYFRSTDARELLVQVQTSDDVPGVRDQLVRLQSAAPRAAGDPLVLRVDRWGGTGWPWGWYLRDLPVGYYDMSDPDLTSLGPLMLVADPNHAVMDPRLRGYVARRFRLRVWWVPDWGKAGPIDWVRWMVFREAWSPTATMDEWLYVKPDLARLVPTGR
jgi:predicted membrane-bound mannosyltransferase